LILLLTAAAHAQDAVVAAGDLVAPAGGLLGGGAAALVVERFLRKGDTLTGDVAELKSQIRDLHDWHSKEDEDGVKVWYVRKSLVDAIENLGNAVVSFEKAQTRQTETLASIAKLVDRMDRHLVQVHEKE
jgi:hypothetical protein